MKKLRKPKLAAFTGLLAALLLFAHPLFAQPSGAHVITGKITSQTSGDAVGGATITVKGTKNAVQADEKGQFSIMAAPGEHLIISNIGFLQKEVVVASATVIDVTLRQDYNNLNDVVVVGYGKMKKTDLSSSQVTVSAEELNRTVNTTIEQALQGKAANVYIASSNAQPGSAPSVIIRGISSLSQGTQPLYVIDGVQIKPADPQGGEAGSYNAPSSYTSPLAGINPDDIETVNVLQGPSATAIFGAAGGAGVIMITTKHGKAGDSKITFNSMLTQQDLPKFAPVMNLPQYATFRNALSAAGGANTETDFLDPSVLGPGSNWQGALFRRTLQQKYNLALSGGSDKTTYYLSGDYFNQDGVAIGSGFTRGSVRLNLENNARKWLKVGTNISANLTKERIVTLNNSLIETAVDISPAIPIKLPNGDWGGPAPGTPYANNFVNPIALATINTNYNKGFGGLGGVYADVMPIKGLVWHTEANGTYNYNTNYQFNPSYTFGITVKNTITASQQVSSNYWYNLHTRLQYDTKIGLHGISAMFGHEASVNGYETLSGFKDGFVNNTVQTLNAGASDLTQSNSSTKGSSSKESYFGRLVYIFNNKYILQGTNRWDGSSNFGANKRWGVFPSVSAAWKISEEPFMKNIPNLDDLKLRAEYGLSGNAGSSGTAQYAVLSSYPTAFGTGFLPSNIPNPNLQWEVDKQTNVGFDLHMFNSRLEVIADAYIKNITKLLTYSSYLQIYGGGTSQGGLTWPETNVGSMRNKGFGVTVNTVNYTSRNFMWKTGINFSLDRNKVTQLSNPINAIYISNTNSQQAQFLTKVGQPVGMITGYIAEGLFQNYKDIVGHANQTSNPNVVVDPNTGTWVGDIKFKDVGGYGVIDQRDRVVIGNPWPKYTFGFNNFVSYKGFDLNIFIIGSVGNDIVNLQRYLNTLPGSKGAFENYYASVINFARPTSYNASDALTVTLQNPNTNVPRVYTSTANGNERLTQWNVESGTYVRVKNVSLSYNFPAKWVSHVAMRGLRVGVNVQNLLTITKYKGYDPEVGPFNYWNSGNPIIINGLDNGRYPNVRMYTANIVADF
ncbi:SusC/RagA family TonB-linked outer membrane protein [Puia dinghuensis]|uniref:SusC/RagA family TonB-linked outer membrane protein n=1 Tax=Puia dinghuensis TaxID=1792502 RepID=A0A8J2XVS9_9BACT|nr:SusC/RagA family TonB-linked outer membrane protein [Puia dinghuensis]GGB20836.1 SusC/RagA family TonB-linked outer membrane protein [Puia dinghuensis]